MTPLVDLGATTGQYTATSWAVWGTVAELVVHGDGMETARNNADAVLSAIDRSCSRFRADSDLTRVNAGAGSWVRVDAMLADVLTAGLWAADVTDGLVDPTLGLVLARWGYDRDFDLLDRAGLDPLPDVDHPPDLLHPIEVVVTDAAAAADAVEPAPTSGERAAWRAVGIERGPSGTRVRVPVGRGLDLGAVGKAFAADAIAHSLIAVGIDGIISLGGDVAVAGTPGAHQWRVAVSEHRRGPVDQTVIIGEGAVATSTTTHRRWRHNGRVAHHIIDPRTGAPAMQQWRAVTVAAASAVDANTASTAAVLLGDEAVEWLDVRGLAARLVDVDGTVTTTQGWPGE